MAKIHQLVLDKLKRDTEAMHRQINETDNIDRMFRIKIVYYGHFFRYLRNANLL